MIQIPAATKAIIQMPSSKMQNTSVAMKNKKVKTSTKLSNFLLIKSVSNTEGFLIGFFKKMLNLSKKSKFNNDLLKPSLSMKVLSINKFTTKLLINPLSYIEVHLKVLRSLLNSKVINRNIFIERLCFNVNRYISENGCL